MTGAKRVIITGGGTGGHLFPGIALANGLQKEISDCRIMFIGTRRQLDREALADYDFQLKSIACMGLKGKGMLSRLKSLFLLPGALLEAGRIILQCKPDFVFGVGGYVTGPVLLAAKLLGVATYIHEQNSVPGLANRMISRFVDKVFVSIPGDYCFAPAKTVVTGNPVRQEIIDAAEIEKKFNKERLTILVLGGSLGAHRINLLMVEAMEKIRSIPGLSVQVIHQTGRTDEERVRAGYAALGISAEVAAFFQDMASLYTRADMVVARAGATTLAELSVMGLGALLIPYPHAADDHQAKNAQYYVNGGGCIMFREAALDGEQLADALIEVLLSPERMQRMAANMKKMGRPEATQLILDHCLSGS